MRKSLFGLLAVMALSLSTRAGAASMWMQPLPLPGNPSQMGLYIQNSLGFGIGALEVLVVGAFGFGDVTGFTFNASGPDAPNISILDSVYRIHPDPNPAFDYDVLIANAPGGGVALIPDGATVLLGTFNPGDRPWLMPGQFPDGPFGQITLNMVYDANYNPVLGRVYSPRLCEPFDSLCYETPGGITLVVPEPSAVTLLALFVLSAWGRRRAG